MSPAEAGEILNEPNWGDLWKILSVADDGYETILRKWREWRFTPLEAGRKKMGSSIDGAIALAGLGIYARMATDRPGGLFAEQMDGHCWLVTEGRSWRILGIEDMTLHLDSFGEPRQIDMNRASWDKYCEGHAAVLEAQMKTPGAHDIAGGSRKEP